MCGGVVGDVLDAVGDVVQEVGNVVEDAVDFVGNTVEHIIEDPLPAIIDIGLISVGVPPVYAGAIGGAVGAAENGGNILEGALVGGASGYAGGAGAGWAAEAGAGDFLSGAAGGAASGATGAALTGGDILQGAAGGGFVGGVGGAAFGGGYGGNDGTQAPVYEYNPFNGQIEPVGPYIPRADLGPGVGIGVPVEPPTMPVSYDPYDYGPPAPPSEPAVRDIPSTGYSDSEAGTVYNGPNGPEVVLDSGKTVLISDLQHALDSGGPISVDGQMTTGGEFKVEVGGAPKYDGMQGAGTPPEGFEVAKPEDVFGPNDTNNGQNPFKAGTYLDPETNTWYTPKAPVEGTGTQGSNYPVSNVVDNGNGTSTTYNPNGSMTISWPDGTLMTTNPDGSSIIRSPDGRTELVDLPSTASNVTTPTTNVPAIDLPDTGPVGPDLGPVTPEPDIPTVEIVDTRPPAEPPVITPPVVTTGPVVPVEDNVPEITITAPREPVVGPPVVTPPVTPPPDDNVPEITITAPREPVPPVVEPPVITPPPPEPPTIVDPEPPVTPPPPVSPPPVVVVPPVPPVVKPPVTPPDTRVTPPSTYTPIDTGNYLNAGLMQNTRFYNTTSPVQAQYHWGTGPTQYAPAYNANLARSNPNAPATPWGMQEMYKPLTAQELADLAQNNPYSYVAGPVAPAR